jgi:hypothetical protein
VDENLVDDDFVLEIVSDTPMTDEELAALTRELLDDLSEVEGIEAGEVTGPAAEGTRDFGLTLLGIIGVSIFGIPNVVRTKRRSDRKKKAKEAAAQAEIEADIRALTDVVKRYQERHKGKRVRFRFANGTVLEADNVSEQGVARMLRSVPAQGGVAVIEEQKSLD